MKLSTLKKALLLLSAVLFFCISPIQSSNAWDELDPSQFEEFPDEDEAGSDSKPVERQLCYKYDPKLCSVETTASGGANAQLRPTPGGGINGTYTRKESYSYICKRGTGGDLSECQSQSCNGSFGTFLRCPKK